MILQGPVYQPMPHIADYRTLLFVNEVPCVPLTKHGCRLPIKPDSFGGEFPRLYLPPVGPGIFLRML